MYDHERLHIDVQSARKRDPQGIQSFHKLEQEAKRTQLSELADAVDDPKVGFILSELIDMVR